MILKGRFEMSFKKLLGLDLFDVTEEEIVEKINEANRLQLNEVEFAFFNKRVKVKISPVNPKGMMKGYQDYYAVK